MTPAILTALMILIPLTISAQHQEPSPAPRGPVFDATALAAKVALEPVSSVREQPRPAQPPAPLQRARRRVGSTVGYVDDATIGSKVRVRFDSGLHNTRPDRAEFFYAKCGCLQTAPAPLTDTEAPGPQPNAAFDLNFQQLFLSGEYGLNERFSAFAEIPLRWIQPQVFAFPGGGFANQSGFSDLRAGVKLGLLDSDDSLVTVQVQAYFPTGEPSKGLGTDHSSIEPALLYFQRLSDRVALESQFGVWHPFGGSAGIVPANGDDFSGNVIYYGIGPSVDVYSSDRVRFTPVVELVGWRVLDGYQNDLSVAAADASGTNIVNLKIGARTTFNDQGSFYFGYGKALTDAVWYEDIFRFEYRYSF